MVESDGQSTGRGRHGGSGRSDKAGNGNDRGWGRRRSPEVRKAVPADARRHNRAFILRTLVRQGPISRADLARATHLTRVTASDLVAELLAEGLVEELGTRTDQRLGKPATLLGLVPDASLVVALDLSDDARFHGALVDLAGKVRARRTVERLGRTGRRAVELAARLASDLAADSPRPLLGAGVGSPGVVDPAGIVLEAPNLGWADLDLAGALRRSLPCPVHVANDANAAVLGELALGDGDHRSLLLVKIGHGVGAGVVVDGHLVVGTHFAAGEIGHVVVDERGDGCACGRTGCLETVIAAPLLRRRLAAPAASPRRVFAAAGRRLGMALAPVVSTLNLREVVLSGPLDLLAEPFRRAAIDTIRNRTMPAVGEAVDLRFTSLGEDDVLLGAAVLVLDRELGIR
jgi:predicted NBD/HSP70 family sugar kinase